MLLNLDNVLKNFICYKLGSSGNILKNYFKRLDNGRYNETKKVSKSFDQWMRLFKKNNLKVKNFYTGLSSFTWVINDIQTRPLLKILIRFFNIFPTSIRTVLKIIWMLFFYPIVVVTYLLGSKISQNKRTDNCYVAFELIKKI